MATKATTLWTLAQVRSWVGITAPAAKSVSSLTSSGTTATATSAAHGFASGDAVLIEGASPTEYNGTYTITVTGTNTFTYTFAGSATTPATGTITATGPETSEDEDLTKLADGASELIERYTRRKYVTRSVTEIRDGDGGQVLFLDHYPVVVFTSLTVLRSPNDTVETIATTSYNVAKDRSRVWLHSDRLSKGNGNVTATYTAGYGAQGSTDLPQAIFSMGLELVKLLYQEKTQGAINAQSIDIGGQTFVIKPLWPKQILQTLNDWRRPY